MIAIFRNITNKRGRPKTTGKGMLIGVRFHDEQLAPLDAWIAEHPEPKPSRPQVIREAVAAHLRAKGYPK
ncbi:hypothetical protein FV232_27125 [Methylobacterium sp. WL30]|nr:hypothetical protein FV223_02500 [Methylobacterium sp. WL116]TXN40073.1 hypothetical protein FV225_07440 [Methylobacterium sp. WL93]TXN48967.1 hypothetical protein FV227_18685 [Methylobacterium sp. WL119]TXN61419.1 hypothetical protein FV232_27125 [Methylobacterium sp. WL30]